MARLPNRTRAGLLSALRIRECYVDHGHVDHFQPKSKFPEHVYDWRNWVWSCPICNHRKLEKWPAAGYVDPCAELPADRPDRFFVINSRTAMIEPNPDHFSQAAKMIEDLDLNSWAKVKERAERLQDARSRAQTEGRAVMAEYLLPHRAFLSWYEALFRDELGRLP